MEAPVSGVSCPNPQRGTLGSHRHRHRGRRVDTDYLTGDPVDYLSRQDMVEVEIALAHYLGIAATRPVIGSR